MPTAADQQKLLDDLFTAWANAEARLAEFDARPVTEKENTTYTVAGRSTDHNGYRAGLSQLAQQAMERYEKARALVGPGNVFTVVGGIG